MHIGRLIAISLLLFGMNPAFATLYEWVDDQGVRHISNRPEVPSVVMYSAEWCGICKQARRHFQKEGIPFKEWDVEKSSKGRNDFRALRGRAVPIILVDGKRINGFSKKQFDRAYR